MGIESSRYSRQMILPQIGAAGQQRLSEGRVVVVGCGALGSVSATLAARAGVGHLRIIDRDFVELSNLQRQTLYTEADVESGMPKAAIAAERLRAANSDVEVEGVVTDLTATNAESLLGGFDVIVDAIDNFEARFLINDVALKIGTPWVYGAVIATYGLTMNVLPGEGPCLRCLLPDPPAPGSVDTCATAGVFGPVVECIAALQMAEAVKLLLGRKEDLRRGLVEFDVWDGELRQTTVPRVPDCPACVRGDYEYLRASATAETISLCGRDALQIAMSRRDRLDLEDLANRLECDRPVKRTPFMLRFEAEGYELNVFSDGRAIVKGTTDETVGRILYAKYVGT
jgi:adenylyltransferase/sulfurtransferase